MSAVIKSESSESRTTVKVLGTIRAPKKSKTGPGQSIEKNTQDPRDLKLEELANEIERLRLQATIAEAEQKKAIKASFEDGKKEGLAQSVKDDAQALSLLKSSLANLDEEMSSQLKQVDLIALAIAQAALRKIFENKSNYSELVGALISSHVAQMRSDMICEVVVSASDFPDPVMLDNLKSDLGIKESIAVRAQNNMETGCCRLDLRLGYIDFSLTDYWDDLCFLFSDLAVQGKSS